MVQPSCLWPWARVSYMEHFGLALTACLCSNKGLLQVHEQSLQLWHRSRKFLTLSKCKGTGVILRDPKPAPATGTEALHSPAPLQWGVSPVRAVCVSALEKQDSCSHPPPCPDSRSSKRFLPCIALHKKMCSKASTDPKVGGWQILKAELLH